MHLLHFGIYEEILYSYVLHSAAADEGLQNGTAFTRHLLLSADPDGETVGDIAPSDASRFRKGKRAIPEDVVALFQKKSARDIIIEYTEDFVVPFIKQGRKQQLIKEFANIVEQDTTIDDEFKTSVLNEAVPEHLPAFLADLLIYAVGVDPTERDKEYPVENYNLPMSNDWFTGRQKELQEIADNFADGCRMQILYGMGGMGKSQIARKYAYDHYRSYSLIHWINAHTIDSIVECYRAFLKEKQIAPVDQTKEGICQTYTKYMDSHSDWLLIYDNCDYYTDKEYADFASLCLPKNRAVGNILITSRNKRPIGKAKRMRVDSLSDVDAVSFLQQRTESEDAAGAGQLAERLGRFPLALEIAGAYIYATPGCNFQTYMGYLEEEIRVLDQLVEVTDYNKTIRDILLLTIKRIKEDRNNDKLSLCIEDTLHLLAYVTPYDIDLRPLAFLPLNEVNRFNITGDISNTDNLQIIKDICANALKRNELAQTLITYGLAVEQANGFLSMHELQQEILRDYIFPKAEWSILVCRAISDFADTDDTVMLYRHQNMVHLTKRWEEMARRNIFPTSTAKNMTLFHREAQVLLLLEQFKMRIVDNPKISPEEFNERRKLILRAAGEMIIAYRVVEEEHPSIEDLFDYMERLVDATILFSALKNYAIATEYITFAFHALIRALICWGNDAVISDSLKYASDAEYKDGYIGRLLQKSRQCLSAALLAGVRNEYLAYYLRELRKWLKQYAKIAHWSNKKLANYLKIWDAYIKGDPSMLS